MRPWDRARWRLQGKWTHDLPNGMEGHAFGRDVLGDALGFERSRNASEPTALRGRLVVDKKWTKRRHLAFGYQWQSTLNSFPSWHEHTL